MKASIASFFIGLVFGAPAFGSGPVYQEASQCKEEQLKFEKNWRSYQVSESEAVTSGSTIAPSCVLRAMGNFENWAQSKPVYASCETSAGAPVRTKQPICKTRSVVENITRLYNQFTQCIGVDAKFFFLAVSSESGFFPNAFAPGADAGIGQLTPEAVVDVNNNWDRLTAPVLNSENPACVQVKAWMQDLRVTNEEAPQSCQFIAEDKNPARNLMYALLLFQQNRSYYQKFFGDVSVSDRIVDVRKQSLSDSDRAQWIDHLSILTYNMGFVRLSTLLIEFLETTAKPIAKTAEQAEETRLELIEIQKEMTALMRDRKFIESRGFEAKVLKLKEKHQDLFKQLRKPLVSVAQLDPLNMEKGAFGAFLKNKKEAHYAELLLQRIRGFTAGTGPDSCVNFN